MHMHGNPHEHLGFFNPITAISKGVQTATKGLTTVAQPLNPLTNLAQQVIQGKQLFDATKYAWKNPFGQPAQQQPVMTTTLPQQTGERFEPASTQIALPKHNLSHDSIRRIQIGLQKRGFDPGPIDGIYGPKTKAGIEAFQASAGQVANGIPTANLLRNLERDEIVVTAKRPPAPSTPTPYPQTHVPPYSTPTVYMPPTPAPAAKPGTPQWVLPAAIAASAGVLALALGRK
jgi:hypothetical protein